MVDQRQKQQDILNALLSSSWHDGFEEGLALAEKQLQEQGRKQERTAIAKGLLNKGHELKEIQELTKLTLEELGLLQKELTE